MSAFTKKRDKEVERIALVLEGISLLEIKIKRKLNFINWWQNNVPYRIRINNVSYNYNFIELDKLVRKLSDAKSDYVGFMMRYGFPELSY